MPIPDRLHTLEQACPNLPLPLIKDFVTRMDPEYFEQFDGRIVAHHLRLAGGLNPENPCAVHITKEKAKSLQLTLVAYDYFSEFATICGVLSAFGLDIREAFIFTYRDSPSEGKRTSGQKAHVPATQRGWPIRSTQSSPLPGLSRKKVVDVFKCQVLPGFHFGPREESLLKEELLDMIRLLDSRHIREARSRVNRNLVETLGKLHDKVGAFIHPVQVHFNNDSGTNETVMDIRSTDTPAFLYAFANALTMRGIYIAKAKIQVKGMTVQNRFYVRGRHGGKIKGRIEQQEITAAAALIKEFTHFLTWAPDPAKALDHFDQLLDQLLEEHQKLSDLSILTQRPLLGHLAQLFGTSDFLWEDFLRRQHINLLPVMKDFQKGPVIPPKSDLEKRLRKHLSTTRVPEVRKERLNQFKDQELFRIDMKHLLENTPLPEFSQALTNLAEVILDQVLREAQVIVDRLSGIPGRARKHRDSFAILALGKLGGSELGYASDIEVLFVYGTDAKLKNRNTVNHSEYYEYLVQEILRWIEAKQEGIFHIDTRLRPHGEKGLLANSMEEFQQYYSPKGMAVPFERQALIKLRHVGGDPALGRLIESHRDQFVYSRAPWRLQTALHIRERQRKELVPPGTVHVKYSPGGLIDVEYTIQYLQLIHGHRVIALRTPNTLQALAALGEHKILSQKDVQDLQEDYLFLRKLIDALRIVRGNAQDLILPPSGSESMIFLARRLGFTLENWQAGANALEKEITRRMTRIHKIFTGQFCRAKKVGKKN